MEIITYNEKVVVQTLRIIALLEPSLKKRNGKIVTSWGNKTKEGLRASIFNILVDVDMKHGNGEEVSPLTQDRG